MIRARGGGKATRSAVATSDAEIRPIAISDCGLRVQP